MNEPATVSDAAVQAVETADAAAVARSLGGHLDLLAAMASEFASSRNLDATLDSALQMITAYVGAEGGALFMLDEAQENLRCQACVGATEITGLTIRADQGIVGRSVQTDEGVIVRDVANDPNHFKGVDEQTGFTTKSIVCAPMSIKGQKVGAIELINKVAHDDDRSGRGGQEGLFDDQDLMLLSTLSTSAAMAVLNTRMAEALVEQERVKREIELAAEIQRSLLPEAGAAAKAGVFGLNVPARTVSGDFYDHFVLDDGRVGFSLGDVSGKGMNAALMMAKAISLYRCLGKSILSPARLLDVINTEICETATRGMFITLVGGIYDPATGVVTLANAGHEPPLLRTADGVFKALEADAPPLGILLNPGSEEAFPEVQLHLEGGALYIVTDGVTEGYTDSAAKKELGGEGLKAILSDTADRAPMDRLRAVASALEPGPDGLRDDLTALVVDDAEAHRARAGLDRRPDWSDEPMTPVKLVRLRAPSAAASLKMIRAGVHAAALEVGFSDIAAHDVMLAVDETCQNVIRHAYGGRDDGSMVIDVERHGHRFVVFVRDYAPPIDVDKVQPRDLNDVRPGGLGTHLIREIMDEVEFLDPPADGGNIVKMSKVIL
jgi:sigma-B regulation protein RsbU (phosphoserine phosphatase)